MRVEDENSVESKFERSIFTLCSEGPGDELQCCLLDITQPLRTDFHEFTLRHGDRISGSGEIPADGAFVALFGKDSQMVGTVLAQYVAPGVGPEAHGSGTCRAIDRPAEVMDGGIFLVGGDTGAVGGDKVLY